MATVKRHWLIPESLLTAAKEAAGSRLDKWVEEALTEWTADLTQVRRLTTDPGVEVPGTPELPDSAVRELKKLAHDPDGQRLNLWLALLSDARWPVTTVVGPILGVTRQSISRRIARGRTLMDGAQAADLLKRIPPIPDAPDLVQPSVPGDSMKNLIVRIDEVLSDSVAEKARRERIVQGEGARTAIREYLTATGHPVP